MGFRLRRASFEMVGWIPWFISRSYGVMEFSFSDTLLIDSMSSSGR